MRKINLVGRRFERLLVLKPTTKRKWNGLLWECRCDCGKVILVTTSSLNTGKVKSCGCLQREIVQQLLTKDEVGNRYEKLLVISRAEKQDKFIWWDCQCDCGGIRIVRGDQLRSGKVTTCGCGDGISLIGNTYGYLTVIGRDENRGATWNCRCVCGKIVKRWRSILLGNKKHSCGCQKKSRQGLSNTKEFRAYYTRQREEKKADLDSSWSAECELYLRTFFPSCVLCGKSEMENINQTGKGLGVDHVFPLSRGYGLVPGNAVILCTSCNSYKLNKNLSRLSIEERHKILSAAQHFECAWRSREAVGFLPVYELYQGLV